MYFGACILLALVLQVSQAATNLTLLALVPLGNMDRNVTNCLDLGEELIPAAKIAAQRINDNPNILAGYNLQIVEADTDQCSSPSIATALGSFVKFTTDKELNVVGIIGLMCPSALLGLSPIASLSTIDILHITSSTASPSIITNSRKGEIGRLYQVAPSSTVFNQAVVALMKNESWASISVIRYTDSVSTEHDYIGSDFQRRIGMESGLDITVYSESASGLARFVQNVKTSGMRIIYTSVIKSEAQELLCRAYLTNVTWPNYLWIFHDYSIENLLQATNTGECSILMMQKALEGVLLIHHDINSDSSRDIDYVNYNYGEYSTLYNEKLQNITSQPICNKEPQILSANALHDSVIAFADALDRSLVMETNISCLGDLGDLEVCEATTKVNTNLQRVDFSGAGGDISFNNKTHELIANSRVNIYQVNDGKLSILAQFDGAIINFTASLNISYTFDSVIVRLPLALPVITLVIVALCIIATIITLVIFIHYRNSPNIKATSPLISYIILFSCFLLYASVSATATRYGFATGQVYAHLCASEQFFFTVGVQLIFASLCVRLLRVSRIFFNYNPMGVGWSDKVLALYIGTIVLVTVFLMVVWLAIGEFSVGKSVDFIPDDDPPHYEVELSCNAMIQPLFLSLVLGYTGLFMVLVMILAIKTRKVSIDVFKDTKSVNIFVFCSVGILALFVPLSYITEYLNGRIALILSYLFRVTSVIVVAVLCVCLLFIPKIYLALFPSSRPRSKSVGNRSSSFGRSGEIQVSSSVKPSII